MAMTPEKLNELEKLKDRQILLLTYELAHETHETIHGKDGRSGLAARVHHLERFKTKMQGAWAAAVLIAGAIGLKIGKTGGGGGH